MAKPEIPFASSTPIAGKPWKVFVAAGWIGAKGEQVVGLCDWKRKTIHISRKPTIRRQMEVIVHEIGHAISDDVLGEEFLDELSEAVVEAFVRCGLVKDEFAGVRRAGLNGKGG